MKGKETMEVIFTVLIKNLHLIKDFGLRYHFGTMFHKKMFITHRKDLLVGDYLIDDRTKNGYNDIIGDFKGEHLHFGWSWETETWNKFHSWDTILDYLL